MGLFRYMFGTSDSYRKGVDDAEEVMDATNSDSMPHGQYILNRYHQSGSKNVEAFFEGYVDRVRAEKRHWWQSL